MSRLTKIKYLLSIRGKFALLLLILTLIAGISFGSVDIISTSRTTIRLIDQEYSGRVRELSANVKEILKETSKHTLLLANSECVIQILERNLGTSKVYGSDETLNRLKVKCKQLIKLMLEVHLIIKRIRYIDLNGNEIIRADFDGKVTRFTNDSELENISNEPFFNEFMNLPFKRVYLSPMEIPSGENGEVSQRTLTIGSATKVVDEKVGSR